MNRHEAERKADLSNHRTISTYEMPSYLKFDLPNDYYGDCYPEEIEKILDKMTLTNDLDEEIELGHELDEAFKDCADGYVDWIERQLASCFNLTVREMKKDEFFHVAKNLYTRTPANNYDDEMCNIATEEVYRHINEAQMIREHLGMNEDDYEQIESDFNGGTLTINKSKDEKYYLYYLDENNEVCYDLALNDIIDDPEEIKELF